VFSGTERRWQVLGETGGIRIVDDFAHHPVEVAATLETARTAV
jgi:UDP-N-acetylmuramate--alanine ligase